MKKIKIFHTEGMTGYSNWIENSEITRNIEEADLVIFTGGEDVHPEVYGETSVHPRTGTSKSRDAREIAQFNKALELNIPILGICRGSQLTCAMAGGKLVQHQNNPAFIHKMITFDGLELPVSSTHHQAQHPFNLPSKDYEILGWSEDVVKFREDGNQKELVTPKDCEVVYYNKINALAIQPHPEMLMDGNRPSSEFRKSIEWFRMLLNVYLNIN